ncbi:MAG: polysaccharide export protein [Pseudomonadota bacterium]|nr:polysaccharide export protein [Pseudomonadota bacterium]
MFRIIKGLAACLAIGITAVTGAAETSGPVRVSPDYMIGPGDTLRVDVWQNPELSMAGIPVLPDGRISTPLVRDMVAVGKNTTTLAKDIEAKLTEFVRSPQVTVTVMHAASAFSQVKIIGQVNQPQAMAYREGMTILDAVLAAGGLAEFAAGNRAKLLRTENGKQKEIRLRLGRLLNDGDLSQNHPLRPGDVLVVPESRF